MSSVLLIDNYDSFVYNLARYVQELGHTCEVHRNDRITLSEIEGMAPTHIMLSPGPCTPNEAGICLALIAAFLEKCPIVGICLGHQAIGQACGASVIRADHPMHGKADHVYHRGEDLFHGLPSPLTVGRYHSLVIDPATLKEPLRVQGTTALGEIMAIRHAQRPVFGLQFHPESILTERGHGFIENFLATSG